MEGEGQGKEVGAVGSCRSILASYQKGVLRSCWQRLHVHTASTISQKLTPPSSDQGKSAPLHHTLTSVCRHAAVTQHGWLVERWAERGAWWDC